MTRLAERLRFRRIVRRVVSGFLFSVMHLDGYVRVVAGFLFGALTVVTRNVATVYKLRVCVVSCILRFGKLRVVLCLGGRDHSALRAMGGVYAKALAFWRFIAVACFYGELQLFG